MREIERSSSPIPVKDVKLLTPMSYRVSVPEDSLHPLPSLGPCFLVIMWAFRNIIIPFPFRSLNGWFCLRAIKLAWITTVKHYFERYFLFSFTEDTLK